MLHSIVIPVFNEAPGVEMLFERIVKLLSQITEPCEVILVNDGSKDGTADRLDPLHTRDPRFKIIHFSRNFGHQVAVTAGIRHASGDTVTVIDADMQDPPDLIPSFIEKWREGFDVVYGVRRKRPGETLFKLATAKIFYKLIRSITNVDIPVDTGDFRLMDRKVVNVFNALPERHRYVRGLVSWVGFRQIGIPYDRAERLIGETHYPLSKMIKFALDGIAAFSYLPLKLATWAGAATGAAAGLTALWMAYLSLFTDRNVPGWAIPTLAILVVGSAQLFALGLIGEYLSRMLDETRGRPLFILDRLVGFEGKGNEIRMHERRAKP